MELAADGCCFSGKLVPGRSGHWGRQSKEKVSEQSNTQEREIITGELQKGEEEEGQRDSCLMANNISVKTLLFLDATNFNSKKPSQFLLFPLLTSFLI